MVPLAQIRAHLTAAALPGVLAVHGAAQLSVALERGQFDAQAYVTLQEVKAGKNGLINAVSQLVSARVGIVSIVREAGAPTGESQADALELRRDALMAALLGWSPDASRFSPMTFVGGKIIDFNGIDLVWADEYETEFLIRSV